MTSSCLSDGSFDFWDNEESGAMMDFFIAIEVQKVLHKLDDGLFLSDRSSKSPS
ncbi:MAG: hypothetical protein ACQEV7_20500 [Bacillota bacterium]